LLDSPATGESVSLSSDERADRALSFDLLQGFAQRSDPQQAGSEVRLHGKVESTEDGPWRLTLYRWEPLNYRSLVVFNVDGMTCEGCSLGLMEALSGGDDVIHVQADYENGRVRVWSESDQPDTDALQQKIQEAGFKADAAHTQEPHQETDDAR
jgi:copper chaperone CopZ